MSRQGGCLFLPFSLGLLGNQFCVMKLTKNSIICDTYRYFLWEVHFVASVLNVELLVEYIICLFCCILVCCFFFFWYHFQTNRNSCSLGDDPGGLCETIKLWSARKIRALLQQWSSMLLPILLPLRSAFSAETTADWIARRGHYKQ